MPWSSGCTRALLGALFAITACGARHSTNVYVAPASEANALYTANEAPAQSYFTPVDRDIAAFESRLRAFVLANGGDDADEVASRLPQYRRQFMGVVLEGRRLIYGNYFCSEEPVDRPVAVNDGGACYFQVYYDTASRTFSRLHVNGHA